MLLLRKFNYTIVMTNFNGLSPWANMLNYLNAVRQNELNGNTNQTQNTQNTQNAAAQNNSQIIQNLSTNLFAKDTKSFLNPTGLNEAQLVNAQEVLKMENEVVQKYLQNLLNMPENIEELLKNVNNKKIDSHQYQFLKIFVENMLSNKELNQLLNQNSQEAIQKLLNVITQSLKYNSSTSQLKDILSVLNTIHTTSSMDTNTLRELFLLYIPIDYQVFKQNSDFKKIEEEYGEKIKNSILSIMLETYSFSNILAILNSEGNSVMLQICANSDFPFEKFKSIIAELSKDNSINVLCDFVKINTALKGQKQNFKVISQNYIPVSIINIAYLLTKTIFKIDNDIKNTEK